MKFEQLPPLMVALNGARRTKNDHANLPITTSEIITEITECIEAGATGFHLHVRNEHAQHSLDATLNNALLRALKPYQQSAYIQLTTEQAGVFDREDQFRLISALPSTPLSVAFKEIYRNEEDGWAVDFYKKAQSKGMDIQHIFYHRDEVSLFCQFWHRNFTLSQNLKALFVLGSYAGAESKPQDIAPFISAFQQHDITPDWAVCAFGIHETTCLNKAKELGGKVRIGFENSLFNQDQSIAKSNAERVRNFLKAT